MKVVHTISSIDQSTGGPARSSTSLIEELLKNDCVDRIDLLTVRSNDPLLNKFESKKGHIHFNTSRLGHLSKSFKEQLTNINPDLFHGHGIWDLPVNQMAKIAREMKIPYVVSIRGMLEPWSLKQSKFKKKVAMLLYQHYDLKKASCLHATAEMEAKSIRDLGYKNPIAVIPNGIDLSEYPMKDFSIRKTKRKILFLSRIHPKKGIEYLIEAWERLEPSVKLNWEIEIAGNGEEGYLNKLNDIINSKSLNGDIKIIGPKFGSDKLATYHSSDLFVLPTHSENFGIVIAEALSCGIPVITTTGTPWQNINKSNSGQWIDIGVKPLLKSLEFMMKLNDSELNQMGFNGRKLIENEYSIESVASKMLECYKWILNKGEKPNFIKI
ncbi:glycosyltransferase [Sphingobacterium faecium]